VCSSITPIPDTTDIPFAREQASRNLCSPQTLINAKALEVLAEELVAAHGHTNALDVPTDVSKLDEVVRLRVRVYEAWGEVSVVRCGLPSPLPPLSISFPSLRPLFAI
jgi:hypothetical protein